MWCSIDRNFLLIPGPNEFTLLNNKLIYYELQRATTLLISLYFLTLEVFCVHLQSSVCARKEKLTDALLTHHLYFQL